MEPFAIKTKRVNFNYTKLVDQNNVFHDSVSIGEAKRMANESGLDLVCFNYPKNNDLALCKIIDYGKWRYHDEKKKKKSHNINKNVVKEIRFSPVIGEHDVEHKLKQVDKFLDEGDEVILSMRFKGIQKRLYNEGVKLMESIIERCKEHGEEVSRKKTDNNITVRLKKGGK